MLASPVISNNVVHFNLLAPNAREVRLAGDWMPSGKTEPFTRGTNDAWTVAVAGLEPGIYIYNFTVDGLAIADPVNPAMKLRARTSASLLEIKSSSPEFWEARDVPHGTVKIRRHRAASMNGEWREFWVYTPPGYERSRKQYPTVYLLHGSNDTPAGWTQVGRANFTLDNLIAEGRAREMVVVMPNGHAVPFTASRDEQRRNTEMMSGYVMNDLMPFVEKEYRVRKDRQARAIAGFSMGGGHALEIGLAHLDRFSAICVFSAGFPRGFAQRHRAVLENAEATNKRLNLLWIGCGREDFALEGSRELHRTLAARGIDHWHIETDGAHTYNVWRQYFREIAPLLFVKLK